jgi:hypothetical protein
MKRLHLLLTALALGTGSTFAQSTGDARLQGILLRASDRQAIDMGNALLRRLPDSTLVTGVVTDSLGSFSLTASTGTYLLELRALGYQGQYKTITLPATGLDLGELLLSEETQQLRGVEVRGRRPIITRQADRLVFDAQQISAGAQNALDVLKRTPGLSVTDEGISIIGRGKAIILINDKRVRLSGEALTGLLRSYSQSDIAEVQVLTTPPAKYEAEGNAGVLNIVMKKAQNDYFGGSISANASLYKGRISPSVSTGLNYKQGRVSASLNLDGSLSSIVGNFDTYRTAPSTQLYSASTSSFDYKGRGVNIRGGLDYTINPELTVGFTATYAPSRKQIDRTNETRNYIIRPDGSQDLQLRLPGAASEKDHGAYTALNLHLEKTFAKAPGRKISWNADYVGSRTSSDDRFASTGYLADGSPVAGSDFSYKGHKGQQVHSYLTNVDVTLPLGQTILAFGAKGTWSRTDNSNEYFAHTTLGARTDAILFDEHVYALYTDITQPLSAKWNLRGGLRMEYTHTTGKVKGEPDLKTRDYVNFFPTLYLGFTPSERHALSFEGTIRLDRPHFSQLSPYPLYENQYSTISGKEDLRPTKQGSLTFGYTLDGSLNFQAFANYSWDGITPLALLDPHTSAARYLIDNAETKYNVGLQNSYFFHSLSFLQCYISHQIGYTTSSVAYNGRPLNADKGLSYSASLNGTLFFNHTKTFSGNFYLNYRTPEISGAGRTSSQVYSSVSLNYSLLNGRLRLQMGITNIASPDPRTTLTTEGNTIEVVNMSIRNMLTASLTYTFGAHLQDKQASKNAEAMRSRF